MDFIYFIRDTQVYKWFASFLSITKSDSNKIEQISDSIPSFMKTSNQNTTRNENDY
jgi:hypothetical protein